MAIGSSVPECPSFACAQCAAQLGQHIKAGPAGGLIHGQNAVWRLHSRVSLSVVRLNVDARQCGRGYGIRPYNHTGDGRLRLRFSASARSSSFNFLEDRVLGIVRIAADLAACSAGRPPPRRRDVAAGVLWPVRTLILKLPSFCWRRVRPTLDTPSMERAGWSDPPARHRPRRPPGSDPMSGQIRAQRSS